MSDVRDLNDFISNIFDTAMDKVAEMILDVETEGLTIEERLRRIEVQTKKNQANIEAIQAVVDQNDANQDKVSNVTMSTVFALAGHVLGRTFSPEEIDSILTEAVKAAPEDEYANGLGAGPFVANAVREHIYNG